MSVLLKSKEIFLKKLKGIRDDKKKTRLDGEMILKKDIQIIKIARKRQFASDLPLFLRTKESLHSLQARRKWHIEKEPFHAGDIVLLCRAVADRNQ